MSIYNFDSLPLENDLTHIINGIIMPLRKSLDGLGIYYKYSYRVKNKNSIESKLTKKTREKGENYKIQDFIGCKFILYFKDDIEVLEKILKRMYKVIDISKNENENLEVFKPERLNFVCEIPNENLNDIDDSLFKNFPIDKTFEIQLRTVFSEGWLEIEHDIRYKEFDNKNSSWNKYLDLTRVLIGLNATLQNCDWTMVSLMERMAYKNYKYHEWDYMIKNKFHLRITDNSISKEISEKFDETDNNIAKTVYRASRSKILKNYPTNLPITIDNIIYITLLIEKIEDVISIPDNLKKIYKDFNNQINNSTA